MSIVRHSAAELKKKRDRGESRTDWRRLDRQDDAALERAIASDPDWRDVPKDWFKDAEAVVGPPKRLISLRLDADVVDWFRARGPRYQTRINAVLRAYMKAKSRATS